MTDEQASVPYFIHEAVCDKMERASKEALDKMDKSNKRLLAALVTVCITLVITVCCFLLAYNTLNNSWINFYDSQQIEEVDNGNVFLPGASTDNQEAFG